MHDVGKIAIPDRVLLKPGSLDAAEWAIMKTHSSLGAKMLEGGRLSPEPGLSFAEARLREGFVSPELKLAVYPFRRLVHRRRAEEPAPGGPEHPL